VSEYTRDLVVASAAEIDELHGTRFADQLRRRVGISYPAIDASAYLDLDQLRLRDALDRRGLSRDGYVLYLSWLARAKGVDDLNNGLAASRASAGLKLVIAGRGPEAAELREQAAASTAAANIVFLDDVDDAEKPYRMAGCAAFVLPSKPRPEFVETFGIALVEKMLAGGGPVVTADTGGIREAVGKFATFVPVDDPGAISKAIDRAVLETDVEERLRLEAEAREYAMQFDRAAVFERLFSRLAQEPVGVDAG
jgi:glycosyltransferase involved in cell wall biosynthesis